MKSTPILMKPAMASATLADIPKSVLLVHSCVWVIVFRRIAA